MNKQRNWQSSFAQEFVPNILTSGFLSSVNLIGLLVLKQRKYKLSIQNFKVCLFVCLMVFNATFNNISFISWRSVLLVKASVAPGKNHRIDKLYHIMLYTTDSIFCKIVSISPLEVSITQRHSSGQKWGRELWWKAYPYYILSKWLTR